MKPEDKLVVLRARLSNARTEYRLRDEAIIADEKLLENCQPELFGSSVNYLSENEKIRLRSSLLVAKVRRDGVKEEIEDYQRQIDDLKKEMGCQGTPILPAFKV